ncbi:MAG: DNRLRE domain-containing protein, partial [Candidatus Nanopelagicales bacterium]|nr:DNRLRE domain-containing protein [Candidatus Nanopelagicales bacterium]
MAFRRGAVRAGAQGVVLSFATRARDRGRWVLPARVAGGRWRVSGGRVVLGNAAGRTGAWSRGPVLRSGKTSAVSGEPGSVSPLRVKVLGRGKGSRLVLTLPKATVARVGVVDVGVSFSADDGYVQTQKGDDVPPTGSAEELLKAGFTNDGGYLARSFLKFPGTSSYRGQQVLSAKLRLRNYYSSSCSDAKMLAQQVTTKVTFKQLSWANQPKVTTARQASFDPAYGWSGSCPAADAVWDVRQIVADWAAG